MRFLIAALLMLGIATPSLAAELTVYSSRIEDLIKPIFDR